MKLNLEELGIPSIDLSTVNGPFTENEIRKIIFDMPSDKAPGPDGFTGLFYKVAWLVIKHDVLRALNALAALDTQEFHHINGAYMVLLPKKKEAATIKDYRPISLIHSFSKLVAKALSLRLTPFMPRLISPNQSAFLKGRQIHDNFWYVQQSAKLLHQKKVPSCLIKVEIARAFDSVSWAFLLELMQHMGFQRCWTNWVSVLLSTASTKILINGSPSRCICHGRGLRQGDPLSPLLFVLVMECLNRMILKAEERNLFRSLNCKAIVYRASLYADDMVVFVAPVARDLQLMTRLLATFAGATRLETNLQKCHICPIHCDEEHISIVQQHFPCVISDFLCKYLGIPLLIKKLGRADIQPLVDMVADWLPTWKARLLNSSGRLLLTKTTLSAVLIFISIALNLPPRAIKAIEKIMRAFLWTGSDTVVAGKCLLAWTRVTRPYTHGGLGVTDLRLFGFALRARWCWLRRVDPQRIWTDLLGSEEQEVRALCDASITVRIGDGRRVLFWRDKWINGRSIAELAPHLVQAVPKRHFNTRTVHKAVLN